MSASWSVGAVAAAGDGDAVRSPAAATSPVRAALRAATAASHRRIEALLQLEQAAPLARYRLVLQGFEAFLSHWEPRVQAALPAQLHGWMRARSRLDFARLDIDRLAAGGRCGDATFADAGRRAARAVQRLRMDGAPAAFGSMYVIEGSALGGQVVARHLAREHGIGADDGGSYFAAWGERTGAMWRDFCEHLDAAVQPGDLPLACEAAVATFDALAELFEPLPRLPAAAPSSSPR